MIELENVTFRYDGRNEYAIKNLSLHIKAGECVVLCGGSGSGKTSVTRLINGLIPGFYHGTLTGSIKIDEQDIKEKEPHELTRIVGSVFQNPRTQFFSTDTDSEMVFGMENCGFSRELMLERHHRTVEDLSIENLCDRDIFMLSGGEKQRIAFGGVYALSPNIYVLDEPSANLDLDGVLMLANVIDKLKKQGKSIIIAEHRLYYLKEIADRVIIMKNGEKSKDIKMDSLKMLSDKELYEMGLRTLNLQKSSLAKGKELETDITLELVNLSASYENNIVFENFNLTAKKGDIIGIVGKNGKGKSTLINIICGIKKEKSGSVLIERKQIKAKKRIGKTYLVMQDPNYQLFCDSVYTELKLAMCGINFTDNEIDDILIELNLKELKEFHPLALSGGQKQRLAIAIALLSNANIILFDEPTSGLDYINMKTVSAILKKLSDNGKTILVISHDDELLSQTCNRIVKM